MPSAVILTGNGIIDLILAAHLTDDSADLPITLKHVQVSYSFKIQYCCALCWGHIDCTTMLSRCYQQAQQC